MINAVLENVSSAETNLVNTQIANLQAKRTRCEKYTRVMGYIRPVSHFNLGKKSEFYSREYFDFDKSMNSKFINDYSCNCEA